MKRTVAQQETLVNHQDTPKIKQFPPSGVSSEETRGETPRVDKIEKLAEWAVKKRKSQDRSGDEISSTLKKSYVSKIENAKIKSIPLDTLYDLAKGLNTTIDEPLRIMGYLPADSVVVHGQVGRFLAAFQELPEDWAHIVSELVMIMRRQQQRKYKENDR